MSDVPRVPINPTTAKRIGAPIPLARLTNPTVRDALMLWHAKKGSRPFPSRGEMVPKPIASILRNVMLISILEGERDFEFRIVGDAAVVVYGQNFQGMRHAQLNALEPGFGDVIYRICDAVCRRREPIAVEGLIERGDLSAHNHQGVFLPLGDLESRVDHVLFVGGYTPISIYDVDS